MPLSASDLAFEVVEVVAREVFFFDGAIFVWRGLFFEGDEFGIGRTLSMDLDISMKTLKCGGKFPERIYLHSNCE